MPGLVVLNFLSLIDGNVSFFRHNAISLFGLYANPSYKAPLFWVISPTCKRSPGIVNHFGLPDISDLKYSFAFNIRSLFSICAYLNIIAV